MRTLLTILFFIVVCCASILRPSAVTYYVSNGGSDLNNGTSTSTPFATITKALSVVAAGDNVYLHKGDTWIEKITLTTSGTAANPITISSYGSGNAPLITGFQTQTGFTNVGNVWTATATNSVKLQNTVLIGTTLQHKARTPNTGWSSMSSYSGSASTVNTSLTGTPNYSGAEVVVRSAHWIIEHIKIASQSTGVLTLQTPLTYIPSTSYGGNGYFIQNVNSALDQVGEYTYDSTTKALAIYSTTSPSVQISTIDTLVNVRNVNYITFDGLSFTGANMRTFAIDTSNHITIQNCSINYCGLEAISGEKSTRPLILNDSIQNCLSGGIHFTNDNDITDRCDSMKISGCYFKNLGTIAGMGDGLVDGTYQGTYTQGNVDTIMNNRFDSIGYNPITWHGQKAYIYRNYITNFGYVKDDAGGIYGYVGTHWSANYNDSTVIRSNIVLNGTGAPGGTTFTSYAACIYLDDYTKKVTIDSNTCINGYQACLFFNNADTMTVTNNLFIDSLGTVILFGGYVGADPGTYANTVTNNITYSQNASQLNQYLQWQVTNSTFDYNVHVRPTDENNLLKLSSTTYSLASYQANTAYEQHSTGAPIYSTSDLPIYYYNPTLNDSTINLLINYNDAKGNKRNIGTLVLHPFQSVLLYKSVGQLVKTSSFYTSLKIR